MGRILALHLPVSLFFHIILNCCSGEEAGAANLKLLERAHLWKRQRLAGSNAESNVTAIVTPPPMNEKADADNV